MTKEFAGKVALITGASSGMGKDFVLRLIREGYTVYSGARRVDRMEDIKAAGGHVLAMDVTNDASLVAGVDEVIGKEGRIDVLINNAGYGCYGAIEDVPLAEARRQFEVNVFGLARLTQLVLPHMRAQGSGRIINISSIAGKIYAPLGGWYHATKHAVEALSDCLRFETRQFGIEVVVIEPGGVETEWGEIAMSSGEKYSGNTVYGGYARGWAKRVRGIKTLAPPAVITELVVKALKARHPKTRYVAGTAAKPMLFLRSILSDRMFDRMLRLAVR
jgi:NAD(P)-dependent dehydrogenase (short-subunit alcohol dehydrogenase family)